MGTKQKKLVIVESPTKAIANIPRELWERG